MLLVWRIVESDRYQDEKDEEWPYDLDQQLNLEKKDTIVCIFTHLFIILNCVGYLIWIQQHNISAIHTS